MCICRYFIYIIFARGCICDYHFSAYFIFLQQFLVLCFACSCPAGQRRLGATQCIDEDECEYPGLCKNGGKCVNLSDRRQFRCECGSLWAGRYCTEPAPKGAILVGGKDFIIVFVFCLLSLLGKYLLHCLLSCTLLSFVKKFQISCI